MSAISANQSGRVVLLVEYEGTAYCGWQRQRNAPSIQACVETALAAVAAGGVTVTAAGRTDTGVHALAQVVHFDPPNRRPLQAWVRGANSQLPDQIRVQWAGQVPGDFDARRSAVSRCYRYLIRCGSRAPALDRYRVLWSRGELDVEQMNAAARLLLGERNFSAFRSSTCQSSSPMRNVQAAWFTRSGDNIVFEIRANAFLHHMVRNIVGTLLAVGRGERHVDWVAELLRDLDRRAAGVTAPAHGLYLADVTYEARFGIPSLGGVSVSTTAASAQAVR